MKINEYMLNSVSVPIGATVQHLVFNVRHGNRHQVGISRAMLVVMCSAQELAIV